MYAVTFGLQLTTIIPLMSLLFTRLTSLADHAHRERCSMRNGGDVVGCVLLQRVSNVTVVLRSSSCTVQVVIGITLRKST